MPCRVDSEIRFFCRIREICSTGWLLISLAI
jgi:hypothetical protein